MSTTRIEAALAALVALAHLPPSHDPNGTLQHAAAEAMREVDEIRRMCRTFKEMGVGAFREMAQASCRTMDAIAKEDVPLTVPALGTAEAPDHVVAMALLRQVVDEIAKEAATTANQKREEAQSHDGGMRQALNLQAEHASGVADGAAAVLLRLSESSKKPAPR